MKKMLKRILSMILVLTTLFLATVPVFAAGEDEEYLADLRLIYADDYYEAELILESSGLEGYKLFDANLNKNTNKTGVFLAYLTTTDIEDAITDIAIMQMNGGYNEGNYEEMIQQSYQEYLDFGENYLTAINYFNMGIDAGHYLSELAFRQLNFYNVVTEGIEEIPEFEGNRLGDIFYEGIDASELATMFMEGNVYALNNIRSLIAMGVSYNEDGLTYLDKVGIEAEKYNADKTIYNNEDYRELAELISPVIVAFKDMFKELEAYESEMNYADTDVTDQEVEYLEYMAMATLMRKVNYLGGKTLYDFCKEYQVNSLDYSSLYPLLAALNEGQLAMAKVNHFYDVVRYSIAMGESEELNAELNALEERYGANPFNVYAGVDRTIFRDTFALTSEAYRADAFTESGLAAHLCGETGFFSRVMNVVGVVGVSVFTAAIGLDALFTHYQNKFNSIHSRFFARFDTNNTLKHIAESGLIKDLPADYGTWKYYQLYDYIDEYIIDNPNALSENQINSFYELGKSWDNFRANEGNGMKTVNRMVAAGDALSPLVYGMYMAGGIMTLFSAIKLGIEINNYYHPEYADIPTAMVDLIETKDGDRYIKYDVVYEAEPQADGTLIAADLNAFSASRWNAMYYTKSYEAGKPLLADEFVISNTNNVPTEKYMPVHRFGEVVCYNLNKYNFNDDHSIFLSVKQSDNQKSAVADVPEIVGSVFSTGYFVLAGGVGIVAGAGGTIGTQAIIKKRKNKTNSEAEATE